MIKQSIHQEDITITSIFAPNIGTPEYIKQIQTNPKAEKESSAVILGVQCPTLNKKTLVLNCT